MSCKICWIYSTIIFSVSFILKLWKYLFWSFENIKRPLCWIHLLRISLLIGFNPIHICIHSNITIVSTCELSAYWPSPSKFSSNLHRIISIWVTYMYRVKSHASMVKLFEPKILEALFNNDGILQIPWIRPSDGWFARHSNFGSDKNLSKQQPPSLIIRLRQLQCVHVWGWTCVLRALAQAGFYCACKKYEYSFEFTLSWQITCISWTCCIKKHNLPVILSLTEQI